MFHHSWIQFIKKKKIYNNICAGLNGDHCCLMMVEECGQIIYRVMFQALNPTLAKAGLTGINIEHRSNECGGMDTLRDEEYRK